MLPMEMGDIAGALRTDRNFGYIIDCEILTYFTSDNLHE